MILGTYAPLGVYNADGGVLGQWGTLGVFGASVVTPVTTITATITIAGIPNGSHLITLYNDTTDALVFDGVLTFTGTTATVELAGDVNTVFTGTWLGDNPPTTGAGLYGTGSTINGVANGFNGEPPVADVTAPVITVSGSAVTTITQFGTAPSFTASTDDGSTVVIAGSVNASVVGSYVLYYNATDTAGNIATQVVRTVIVQAAVILPEFTGIGVIANTYSGLIVQNGIDSIYNNSDVRFVKIPYVDDVAIDATTLQSVDYFIVDRLFNVVLHKTINDGITLNADGINVHIDDIDNLVAGNYYHQLQFTVNGDKLQPAMLKQLRILNSFRLNGSL
jgi:hypothetical protein